MCSYKSNDISHRPLPLEVKVWDSPVSVSGWLRGRIQLLVTAGPPTALEEGRSIFPSHKTWSSLKPKLIPPDTPGWVDDRKTVAMLEDDDCQVVVCRHSDPTMKVWNWWLCISSDWLIGPDGKKRSANQIDIGPVAWSHCVFPTKGVTPHIDSQVGRVRKLRKGNPRRETGQNAGAGERWEEKPFGTLVKRESQYFPVTRRNWI